LSQVIKKLKPVFEEKTYPIIDFFHNLNISPNILTVSGLILVFLGSYFIYTQNFFLAGIFVLLGNLCDALDGSLARKYNRATKFGAFLDSVIDRVSDFLPLMSAVFVFREDDFMLLTTLLAVVFSFMVSYTRARAEGLGIDCKIGIFERPERSIILILSLFLSLLDIAVIVIAAGAFFTTVQRIYCVMKRA